VKGVVKEKQDERRGCGFIYTAVAMTMAVGCGERPDYLFFRSGPGFAAPLAQPQQSFRCGVA
jgi:hypothetical protein